MDRNIGVVFSVRNKSKSDDSRQAKGSLVPEKTARILCISVATIAKERERGRVANRLEESGGDGSGNPDWRVQRGDVIGQCEELSV